jgi:hypothetical protein
MLQDLDQHIQDKPDRAETLLSTIIDYVFVLTWKLGQSRFQLDATLDSFHNQLKKLKVGVRSCVKLCSHCMAPFLTMVCSCMFWRICHVRSRGT